MNNPQFRFSSAGAIALCPGRPNAEAGLPEPEDSDDASRGTDKHAVCAAHFTLSEIRTRDLDKPTDEKTEAQLREMLSESDRLICDTLIENTQDFIDAMGGLAPDEPVLCEKAFEWNGWSGHPDFLALAASRTTILLDDWKSGYSRRIPEASSNGQLRGYFVCAALAADEYGWDQWTEVIGRINQPFGTPRPCRFGLENLDEAMRELDRIREKAESPDAPRIPHPDACRYCKALGTSRCPEGFGMGLQLMSRHVVDYSDAKPEWLVAVVRSGEVVKRIVDQAKDEIERRMKADPKSVPGARIVLGDNKREIVNPKLVLARMLEQAPLPVLIEKGAIKLLLGGIKKVAGGKDAEAKLLSGCVETNRTESKVEV